MPAIPGVVLGIDHDDPDRNPCTFKKLCRNCNFCNEERRPTACIELHCEHYTPCRKCKRNLPLNFQELCTFCDEKDKSPIKVSKKVSTSIQREMDELEQSLESMEVRDGSNQAVASRAELQNRKYEITAPGVAPNQYTESERTYYLSQWEQYKGFYRDPTAYSVLHNIILLEVELNWVNGYMLSQRGEIIKELEVKQQRLIQNLRVLRDQLPEKEAQDLSDDEKSIAMIYQRYCEEIKVRRVGKLSRMLSPEAYVLADNLHFKFNPMNLLMRMGYKPIPAAEAVDRYIDPKDIPQDPQDFLQFMGCHLREKFASPEGAAMEAYEDGSMLGNVPEFPVESKSQPSIDHSGPGFDASDPVQGPSLGASLTSDEEFGLDGME